MTTSTTHQEVLEVSRIAVWSQRFVTLARALGHEVDVPPTTESELSRQLARVVDVRERKQIWLALAVLTARFPEESTVVETARHAELDPSALLRAVRDETTRESALLDVVVETSAVVVDVANTIHNVITTGIQRVVREISRYWVAEHPVTFVSWTHSWDAMRALTPLELGWIREGRARPESVPVPAGRTVVVPWGTTYLLPEVGAEPDRASRVRTMALFGGVRTTGIVYDLIPVSSGETVSAGATAAFLQYLAEVRHFDRVTAISQAAAHEFRSWQMMLRASGLPGPEIGSHLLPATVSPSSEDDLAAARQRLCVGALPLILIVGSHEPRKNHLAVLHAAELLWREGLAFSLAFVGGTSWLSDEFHARVEHLQDMGRPIDTISRASDALLWAAYRLARFTIFPSLNEGFGLPVAESLAAGTPVITSAYGSTEEIAAQGGGAVLVDPRDDHAIADAMRLLLTDDATLDRLRREAAARSARTWSDYANDVWEYLVTSGHVDGDAPRNV